jgi:hypothetical protein
VRIGDRHIGMKHLWMETSTMPPKCTVTGGGSWYFEECPHQTQGTSRVFTSVSRKRGNDEITNFIINWY